MFKSYVSLSKFCFLKKSVRHLSVLLLSEAIVTQLRALQYVNPGFGLNLGYWLFTLVNLCTPLLEAESSS